MAKDIHQLVIIGSGPAGLTAAIYAARAGLSPVVIQGREPGGQLTLTTEVEDFPGFPDGAQGPELMERFKQQAQRFGTVFWDGEASSVNFSEKPFSLMVEKEQLKARSVIVATGASARWLGLPSEQRLIGNGVSSCAVCDGYFFRNKEVAVVGGGDTAIKEALYLSKLVKRVTVMHRRESFRANKILLDRAKKSSNIDWRVPTVVSEVLGEERVSGLKLKNVKTGDVETINCQGLFVAVGHKPNTAPFVGQLELDEAGYVVSADGVHTSVEGVFVAGDVRDQKYRQAVTAAGMGCAAAMEAGEYLESLTLSAK